MNKPVSLKIAKLLKEKGFDKHTVNFYTKPNSKMFGIDEHGRYYPSKNISKKLYTVGVDAVLNIKNIYCAPTIAEVVMWLYEKYGIWITVSVSDLFYKGKHNILIHKNYGNGLELESIENTLYSPYDSPIKAYESAIEYTLNNLV